MDLRISLAGHLRIEMDGAVVAGERLGALVRLALAYLVSERHRPVPTDELARVLWDDGPPPTWRTALRGLMAKVRDALAAAGLERDHVLDSGPGWYQLRLPVGVVVDVEEATSSLRGASEALRLAQQRGAGHHDHAERARDLAVGALEVAARPFLVATVGAWAERRQVELAETRLQALEALADALTLAGDPTAAVARAEEAISLEPLRETAHVALMAALAAGGNRGAALRAYERCRRLLAEELGVNPSPQTEAAYLRLLGTEPSVTHTVSPTVTPGDPPSAGPFDIPTGDTPDTGTNPVLGPRPGPPALPCLPVAPTSFVGRQAELADARGLLDRTRLLTVTGPGGVGKSRLALHLARQWAGDGEDVALVELAPLAGPDRLADHVAEVVGLADDTGEPVLSRLVAHLAPKRLLLVLDNCEHLVEACAVLADVVLASCPGVRILATSQRRLHLAGETTWGLAPLGLPPGGAGREDLLASEAAALFVARAQASRPDLAVTETNAAAVARICRRLDGLPLALELAAAHARLLSLEQIATELDDRFDLLADGVVTSPLRHQTMRAALDWSWSRLTTSQARLLAHLSVFAGGFAFDAAQAVAAGDDAAGNDADGPGLYPDLAALVDASLVQADPRRRVARYGMLETVSHHARQRLEDSGEAAELDDRHLAWATSLAEEVAPHLEGGDQRDGLDRLEAEHANLAAALTWGTSTVTACSALPLAAALGRYWEVRGHLSEGLAWLAQVLDDGDRPPAPVPERVRALVAAAALAQRQGDDDAARSWLEEGLTTARAGADLAGEAAALHGLGLLESRAGDVSSAWSRYLNTLAIGRQLGAAEIMATALANLGWLAQRQADFATAHSLLEESLRLYRSSGATYGTAWSLYFLGRVAEAQGDLAGAAGRYEESLALRQELGDRTGVADTLAAIGSLSLHQGDLVGAGRRHEESLALRRELGDRAGELESLRHLGDVARLGGELAEARRRYRESLAIAEDLHDDCCVTRARLGLARVARAERAGAEVLALLDLAVPHGSPTPDALLVEWLEGAAGMTLDQDARRDGRAHDDDEADGAGPGYDDEALVAAARLWGAAHSLRDALGVPVPGGERAGYDADIARGRRALGDRRWDAAVEGGRALSPEAATAEARHRLRLRAGA